MPINGLGSPTAMNTQALQAPQGDMGRDAFLKLLVAQLKNQDPLNPTDSKEMITQLSQLTSVDQLQQISARMQSLEVATMAMSNGQVTQFVGRNIEANTSSVTLNDSQNAVATFSLASRAENVTVTFRNSDGDVIRTISAGGMFPGQRSVTWDGLDEGGNRMPAGRYSMSVSATASGGAPVPVETKITGAVGSVSYENGYPELIVGNARVLLGDVTSIASEQ